MENTVLTSRSPVQPRKWKRHELVGHAEGRHRYLKTWFMWHRRGVRVASRVSYLTWTLLHGCCCLHICLANYTGRDGACARCFARSASPRGYRGIEAQLDVMDGAPEGGTPFHSPVFSSSFSTRESERASTFSWSAGDKASRVFNTRAFIKIRSSA